MLLSREANISIELAYRSDWCMNCVLKTVDFFLLLEKRYSAAIFK